MALSLTAGQLSYWRKRLGQNASVGQISQARSKQPQRAPQSAAAKTWTPTNLRALAAAWQAKGNAPTQQMIERGFVTQPPQPAELPYSASYDEATAAQDRNDMLGETEFNDEEQRLRQSYGLDDQSDPFSAQARLNQLYQSRVQGTTTSMAAAGHLYSGSLQNAQNQNRRSYEESQAGLRNEYDAKLQDLAARRLRASVASQNERKRLAAARLDAAIATPPGG